MNSSTFNTTVTNNMVSLFDNSIYDTMHNTTSDMIDTSTLFVDTIKIMDMIDRINIIVIGLV